MRGTDPAAVFWLRAVLWSSAAGGFAGVAIAAAASKRFRDAEPLRAMGEAKPLITIAGLLPFALSSVCWLLASRGEMGSAGLPLALWWPLTLLVAHVLPLVAAGFLTPGFAPKAVCFRAAFTSLVGLVWSAVVPAWRYREEIRALVTGG